MSAQAPCLHARTTSIRGNGSDSPLPDAWRFVLTTAATTLESSHMEKDSDYRSDRIAS